MNSAAKIWYWDPAAVPAELHSLLTSLSEIFPLKNGHQTGSNLSFEKISGEGITSEVRFTDDGAVIGYNCTTAAGRGVGSVLAGLSGKESTPFTMLGIMLDVSRNMVFTVEGLTRIFRRLALLGYNTVLLYSEDTYELPDEPCFGMLRGRYTAGEIRLADDIAHDLGIELMGCIQTLGHLQQALRWMGAYGKIKDTASVMMTRNEDTMKLVGKMLDFWSANLRSRRIHVGMDETHDLGRGAFLDKNGYVSGFELFVDHLNAVNKLCIERGLKPMIWSDMFFRLGNPNQEYYDLTSQIPADVVAKIPKNAQLVYWDYYNKDQDFYEKFIQMHRNLGSEPLMGAGVWIWSRLWYDHQHSGITNRACLAACRNQKVQEVFFTMWGDDGAICHFDSAYTGLTEAADLSFGHDDEEYTAKRYKALTGSDYKLNRLPGELHLPDLRWMNTDLMMFYDDLLLGICYREMQLRDENMPDQMIAVCQKVIDALADHRDDQGGGDLDYGWRLANYLKLKLQCRQTLVKAYSENDRAALKKLADTDIPEVIEAFDAVTGKFRSQWLNNGKYFGLETMQHRMGGQRTRLTEAIVRINEYLAGTVKNLPELEEPMHKTNERMMIYCDAASGSVHI